MFLEGMLNRGSLPVLQQVMAFTEARQEVLANNVTNFDTVGYKVKDLPQREFFDTLSEAIERRDRRGASETLRIENTRHLQWDQSGRLQAQPLEIQESNILFHDQNNRSVEKQMSEMAQNGLLHNMVVELLRQQYSLLQSAISGRV